MEQPVALESISTYKCTKCYKVLKTIKTFRKHTKTCKEISSPLECPHCHAIFSHQSSKSRHMIKCPSLEERTMEPFFWSLLAPRGFFWASVLFSPPPTGFFGVLRKSKFSGKENLPPYSSPFSFWYSLS